MDIEKEIFKRCTILYDKLIPFGFTKENNVYLIEKNILEDNFLIRVYITSDGMVRGMVIDLAFGDEYAGFRINNQKGQFVGKIREEFTHFLEEIRDNCTMKTNFMTNQANRITNLIEKEYGDKPEFLWEGESHGVFRNKDNLKWYGIIMNINKNKLAQEDKDVEILNVKLDEKKVQELLKRKGFYKAYHMNKEKWITIILDDTIKDDEIMSYIKESYQFTSKPGEWIIPANPTFCDTFSFFKDKDTIMWKQSNNVKVGDIVYLYIGAPYSSIIYKCQVVETALPYNYEDKNLVKKKVMKIKLLKQYESGKYSISLMKEYGVKAVRGPRRMPEELRKQIKD